MGQQQSKDELLFQQVNYGNSEGIKSLHRDGASLEWIDREAKTPLIAACMNPELYNVAKTLIELGANINAYRPGRHAGTPLHHAAKRGLENMVKLLLSHGANALVINDDCQTPLEVARAKGYINVVRTIEENMCLFSGWMREFHGPGFLEVLAPQFVSRKVWVVVLPSGSRNARKPFKLELAMYPSLQDPLPRMVIELWKANMEEPKLTQSDLSVVILNKSTRTRIKLAPANEGDRQQLQWFTDACKGIPSAMHHPVFLHNSQTPVFQATAPPESEELELAMAINESLQSAMIDTPTFDTHSHNASTSTNPANTSSESGSSSSTMSAPQGKGSQWGRHDEASPSSNSQNENIHNNIDSIPTAPPLVVEDGPIHYPSIDLSEIDISSQTIENNNIPSGIGETKDEAGGSLCVICLDAPSEAVCVPCGHAAGCMSCLNEVKAKKWGCPVCRAKIDQVIRLYRV